ncbi:hypothetical protein SEA_PRAIRIE_68 [Arthrobacter phage Prairie]|uniref:Uncharacterized protein n=1 Tax=Arthrobacter phage Prairie TaxID=2816463 RepID=A0A8A5LKD5_9CAUD|nr:hypothetical protein SEA_PRAIRIE_68 [Arthrobacter phage Prairie]
MSKYRLETARPSGWIVEYDGDDPVEYAKAVVGAAVDGRTTRATCVGSRGDEAPGPRRERISEILHQFGGIPSNDADHLAGIIDGAGL